MAADKSVDFKRIGNTTGEVLFDQVDSQNNKQAVMIRRIFPNPGFRRSQYIGLQMSGALNGSINVSAPACYNVRCGEKPVDGIAGVTYAENGDLILFAPRGRIRIVAQDIDLIAEGNGNTTSSPMYGYDYPSYVDRIEGIMNDAVLVIQVKYSGGTGGNQYPSQTMIIVDTEYQPNIDDHMRSQYQYWCPTAYMAFTERFLEDNNTESYTSSNDRSGSVVGMVQTSGQSHQNENQYASSSSAYHMGYYSTNFNDYNYSSFFPPPWFDMPDRAPAAGGNSGYIMQPLMYYGRHGSVMTSGNFYHKNYKEFSALRGMWRTNDNSFFTGERVTDDKGRNYRAMRLYKTGFVNTSATGYGTAGHSYSYAHSRSATYLFPESGQL